MVNNTFVSRKGKPSPSLGLTSLRSEAHAGDLQGGLGRGPLRGQGAVHFAPFDPGDGAAGRQSQRAGWGWADARGLRPLTPTRPSWDAGQVGKGRGV